MYLQAERCGVHGSKNMDVWKSPLWSQSDGRMRKGLLDTQITAIVWALSRLFGELPKLNNKETCLETANRQKLRGPRCHAAMISDSMGLGKTLTVIALLDLMVRRKLHIKKGKHYPILITTPNVTVNAQWADEFLQSTARQSIRLVIVSGGTDQCYKKNHRLKFLSVEDFKNWPKHFEYVWDPDNEHASQVVILMPIDTFAHRTVRPEKMGKLGKLKKPAKPEKPKWTSAFPDKFRKFSVMVCDEAFRVKNMRTKAFQSLYQLECTYTIEVTATPVLNTLADLLGQAAILWKSTERYLRTEHPRLLEGAESTNKDGYLKLFNTLDPWDDQQLMAASPAFLSAIISKRDMSEIQTAAELCYFERLVVLKRAPASALFRDFDRTETVPLDSLFPQVTTKSVYLQPPPEVQKRYTAQHIELLIPYLKLLKTYSPKEKKKVQRMRKENWIDEVPHPKKYQPMATTNRLFNIASASCDVYRIDAIMTANDDRGTKAGMISALRKAGTTLLHLEKFLQEEGEDAKPKKAVDLLRLATRRSPVLQYILCYVKENILDRKKGEKIKKLLITETVPILAYYYELVLQFIGISARTFHSDLNHIQRKELVDSFNSDEDDSCQILIQMYGVAFAGSNLHKNCSRVLVASQSHSLGVQLQAIHRVIRVGQAKDCTVHRIIVDNTYHAFRTTRQCEKLLPELAARAQGPMKNAMVSVLNHFQSEINDARKSEEGQQLIKKRRLVQSPSTESQDAGTTPGPNPDAHVLKKSLLHDGKFVATQLDEIDGDHQDHAGSFTQPTSSTSAGTPTNKRSHGQLDATEATEFGRGSTGQLEHASENDGEKGWWERQTRKEYYEEYKSLPDGAKGTFSHPANEIKRLLSFGNENGAPKVWNETDLEDPAVLERALELLLRVRLGSERIAMLPIPMIDLSMADEKKRKQLIQLIRKVDVTEQDVEAAAGKAEAAKTKDPLGEAMKNISSDQPLAEIGRAFNDQIKQYGADAAAAEPSGADAEPKVKKEQVDDKARMTDISAIGDEDDEPKRYEHSEAKEEINDNDGGPVEDAREDETMEGVHDGDAETEKAAQRDPSTSDSGDGEDADSAVDTTEADGSKDHAGGNPASEGGCDSGYEGDHATQDGSLQDRDAGEDHHQAATGGQSESVPESSDGGVKIKCEKSE